MKKMLGLSWQSITWWYCNDYSIAKIVQVVRVLLCQLWGLLFLLLIQGVLLWSFILLLLKFIRSMTLLLLPPLLLPQSPIPFSDAENIPTACCANPPAPRAPLQPIEEVVSDAEDFDTVVERLEDQIGDETTLSFLTGNNQGQGAHPRAVRGLARCAAPYPHRMQPGDHSRPRSFELEGEQLQQQRNHRYDLRRGGYQCSSLESNSSSEDCVLLDGLPAWAQHKGSSSSLAYWSRSNVLVDAGINLCWLLQSLQAWTSCRSDWGRGLNGPSVGWSWGSSRGSSRFGVLGEGWRTWFRVQWGCRVVLFDQYLLLHLE